MSEQRRTELVDFKFTRGLTPEEQAELTKLNQQEDDKDTAFYKPLITALKKKLNEPTSD